MSDLLFNLPAKRTGGEQSKPRAKKKKPPYYSVSQINLFLKCPHAYAMRYYEGIKSDPSPIMAFGSYIHLAIEDDEVFEGDIAEKYVKAARLHLKNQGDKIISTEEVLNFKIGKHNMVAKVDAFTQNGFVLDYKITSAPSYYMDKLGYQLPIYKYAAKQLGIGDYTPKYVFLKRNKAMEFMTITEYCPTISDELMEDIINRASIVMDQMDAFWKSKEGPMNFNGCGSGPLRCEYRRLCAGYTGVY